MRGPRASRRYTDGARTYSGSTVVAVTPAFCVVEVEGALCVSPWGADLAIVKESWTVTCRDGCVAPHFPKPEYADEYLKPGQAFEIAEGSIGDENA